VDLCGNKLEKWMHGMQEVDNHDFSPRKLAPIFRQDATTRTFTLFLDAAFFRGAFLSRFATFNK